MKSTENLYRLILSQVSDGYLVQNSRFEIVLSNESAQRILHPSSPHLEGTTTVQIQRQVLREDKSPIANSELPAHIAMRSGQAQENVVLGIVNVDASVTWIRISSYPITNPDDESEKLVLSVFSDITKEIQDRHESQNLQTTLLEAQALAKMGNWSFDPKTNEIFWSPQMYEIFGMPDCGRPPQLDDILLSIHFEDRALWLGLMRRAFKTKEDQVFRFRVVRDHSIAWAEGRIYLHIENGEIRSAQGICQDITEQIQSKAEAEFIFNSLRIGSWKYAPATGEVQWDARMYDLFAVDAAFFLPNIQAWANLFAPDSDSRTEFLKKIQDKKDFDATFEIRTTSNTTRFITTRATLKLNEDGAITEVFGICWDRTHEVELERTLDLDRQNRLQNERLAALGQMAASIAHEINNPMGIITGQCNLLLRTLQTQDKNRDRVASIQKASERIIRVVNGMRKFSRSNSTPIRAHHRVETILQDVMELTRYRSLQNHVPISYHTQIRPDATLYCDEIEIAQVMVNLINNAIDAATEQASRWVKVNVLTANSDFLVTVTDSGAGIPDDVQKRLFDPFFTTKKIGKGTGLGLSICNGIVTDHKGELSLKKYTTNTTFEFRIPLCSEELKKAS